MLQRTMKFGVLVVVLLAMTGCQAALSAKKTKGLHWRRLAAGRQEAAAANRPVLVDFFVTVHCPRCGQMDSGVYEDPATIARINEQFVPVRVNLMEPLDQGEEALMAELGNDGECILAFLNPDGTVVRDGQGRRISTMGMLPPAEFNRYLDLALENWRPHR